MIWKSLLACLLCGTSFVFAHPHVFIDATVKAVFDDAGFSAIRNHWVYDELYSSAMMSSGDTTSGSVKRSWLHLRNTTTSTIYSRVQHF